MVKPTTGPLVVRNHPRVSRAVSESARKLRPALRAGVVSRVAKPAKSGKGSHNGSDRGPVQRLTSCSPKNARFTQVNVQDEPSDPEHSASNSPRVRVGPIPS